MTLLRSLNPHALQAPESGIVAVVNHGRGREGLIPLWVGEGDLATPDFISNAATESLRQGETFYTWQRGIPELRQALAVYHAGLFDVPADPERYFVTGSGMQAIRIAIDALAPAGSEIVYLDPAWPNFAAALTIAGSHPVAVPLDHGDEGWTLDLNRLERAIGAKTRALFINSPANPTGWVASSEDLRAILDLARRHGLWIIADEIYARFHYDGACAPSFHDVAEPDERILYVNSFSKNWSMTGWRVGWIEAPSVLGQTLENLIQYATSGVAPFMQRAAIAALGLGEAFLGDQIERAGAARDILCDALLATNRVRLTKPAGAFYAFFAIDGLEDSRIAAFDIVDRCGVGLAPGSAFGLQGRGYLRACFHRRLDHVQIAAERLQDYVKSL